MNLRDLGWNHIQNKSDTVDTDDNLIIGRVVYFSGRHYKIITTENELNAVLPNSYLNTIQVTSDVPAVGDWVGLKENPDINSYSIKKLYPRKNKLSRKIPGKKSEEQIIATNFDYVFIVTTVDSDFNLRRLERYLSMVFEINAYPVIIINKIDKKKDIDEYIKSIEKICRNVPIIPISAKTGDNISDLSEYFATGKTSILIGSSGVGKSTIINTILGYSRQVVGETRPSDDKGRHVTTNREMIILPGGGIIIDNPGIRELQLWSSGEGISRLFHDIEELSNYCKFNDCSHDHEPGCAVIRAVHEGKISIERLNNYKKLLRENEYLANRRNIYEKRKKDKQLGKMYRRIGDIKKLKRKEY